MNQCGLTGTGNTGHHIKRIKPEVDVDMLQVVFGCTEDLQKSFVRPCWFG